MNTIKQFDYDGALLQIDGDIEIERSPVVLPLDKATLDVAVKVGRQICEIAHIATKFSMATKQTNRQTGSVRLLDLGSGTGGLSIVAALAADRLGVPIEEVVAVDSDPQAVENTKSNYRKYLGEAGIQYAVCAGSWDDDSFWQEAGRFDVVVCNPPYLVAEDAPQIRPGYELVRQDAMYVQTSEELEIMYQRLTRKSLEVSNTWSQIHFRLPREGDALVRRMVFDEGPQNIFTHLDRGADGVGDRLSAVSEKQNHFLKIHNEDPEEKFGQPLHTLAVYRFPAEYPFSSTRADVGLQIGYSRSQEIDNEEYLRLMEINGYPGPIGDSYSVQFL